MSTTFKTSALALAFIAGFASSTLAQNSPLGDGTGLQKNSPGLQHNSPGLQRDLRVPGTGTPAPGTYRDIAAEVRFRNAIITGNAPGGVAFRGNAGYTDPMDFRGRLGSDDLFAFRRDSLASGAAGVGIRGIDSLQYQFSMTSGNVAAIPGQIVNRGEGAIARPVESIHPEASLITGSLRSSATFAAERTLRPAVIGMRQPTAGTYERLFASGLTGLHYQPWTAATNAAKEQASNKGANAAVPGASQPLDLTFDLGISPFDQSRDRLKKSLEKANEKATEKDNSKPADTTQPTATDPLGSIDRQLSEIRNALLPRKATRPLVKDAPPPGTTPTGTTPSIPMPVPQLDRNTLAAIKDAGAKADTLIPILKTPAPADLYSKYMTEGEKLLTSQRFFDAEERYALALNSRAGDLSAMVGRLHSQIGAGMKVSAGMNLRRLIMEHPEVLGMTYDLKLMGGQDRVGALREKLRGQVADGATPDTALVLAYLGRQCGEEGKADLAAGLGSLEKYAATLPKDSPEAVAEARLVELLNVLWNAR